VQLNNQSRPLMFKNTLQVVSYFQQKKRLDLLYQGLSVNMTRQVLLCGLFAVGMDLVENAGRVF
jgi:hypothetical protein